MESVVYILHSKKLDRYYVGFSTNLDVRLRFHQNQNSSSRKFTAKANDWIVYFKIPCDSKSQGLNIERHIKRMKSKKYIENLTLYPEISEKLKLKYIKSC